MNVNLSGIVDNSILRSGGSVQNGRGRNSQRENIMQARQQDRQRELKIRAREDERIADLQERMGEALANRELSLDTRKMMAQSFADRIAQIHRQRADRETAAAELEAMRTQALIEANTAPENRRNQDEDKYETREEAEEARNRAQIDGLTRIAAGMDNVASLRQVRTSVVSELGHLERAMDSPAANFIKIGGLGQNADVLMAGQGIVVSQHIGRGADDFRNHQAGRLNQAIGRIDGAINMSIANMYRESTRLQENRMGEYEEERIWESPADDD
ncbi:MAG: hypothetical protein FWE21_09580 [Defluviitaleaceae bacterium]|nr:hypothetical protein [Defluviitaleaceae bacterium]